MSVRKIIVVSTTRTTPKVLNSAAETWGELQDALVSDFGSVSSLRAVVKETKNDLTSAEAVLPEGDFTLFLTPKQIKAGGLDIRSILETLKEKWNDAIDDILDGIDEGDYSTVESSYSSSSASSISAEDRKILEDLKRGSF